MKSKKMRTTIIFLTLMMSLSCKGQTDELQYRSIDYYFEQIAQLEFDELIRQKILIDSNTIAKEYLDVENDKLNVEGFIKYGEIRMDIYSSYFDNYLYQQHIAHNEDVYVLYFTVAGFDDIEWHVVKWKKEDWRNEDKLNPKELIENESVKEIFWNYDEGPKNMENIRLFIQKDYLVFERGNLYHSLYDLEKDSLLFNENSPWHASNADDIEKMNQWIKLNLHDKIEEILNK